MKIATTRKMNPAKETRRPTAVGDGWIGEDTFTGEAEGCVSKLDVVSSENVWDRKEGVCA